jgi:xanthine dehydrogenase large subunit
MANPQIKDGVAQPAPHDSQIKHVAGEAAYVDDILEPQGVLHLYVARSEVAHGVLESLDVEAVRSAPGVVDVLTFADIPGKNDVSVLHKGDDFLLTEREIQFYGQALFAVAATSFEAARAASKLAKIEVSELPAILSIEVALEKNSFVEPPHTQSRGDVEAGLQQAPHKLSGSFEVGGQDHFYLEGQVSMAVPGEDGDVHIHCSTQHPSEIQANVAQVLDCPSNAVTVEVRRMGGGFGGKESQATQWAALAALAAIKTGRPVKLRLERDDDMILTGKRHPFLIQYEVGFDGAGQILALDISYAADCGCSSDLSGAIVDRALFHADNGYFIPAMRAIGHRCRTNKVSNTAFRGFGGPQGMMGVERVIEQIARETEIDPLVVRQRNLYGEEGRNVTHYGMTVEDNVLPELMADLAKTSDYEARRKEIAQFNETSSVLKKGLSLTPVKFGISYTTTFLNQAGALIHIYADGSIHLNHGGTEMGQGLFVKVAQVVAEELQVDLARIKITATHTGKVPNTSATAASSGADMNGMAAQIAARELKDRLAQFAAQHYQAKPEEVIFKANEVQIGSQCISFDELVRLAYLGRVSLSATGFYKTPKIFYDRDEAQGRPFYYFAYGAAISEVIIDTLTGESKVIRVDILHDVGKTLNPAVDLGQIEGGFVQGMGWLTSEELWWNSSGKLMTHAPSTYKIPTAGDRPEDFRMALWDGRNVEESIHRSKAVGEPPLMLAISVFFAISDAIASLSDQKELPDLQAPATPEAILRAVTTLQEGERS